MEIVINKCFGGFGLSHKAVMRYAELKGITLYPFIEDKIHDFKNQKFVPYTGNAGPLNIIYYSTQPLEGGKYKDNSWFSDDDIKRDDPCLVETVKELGADADGFCADLKIVEIPDGVEYEIHEYDGQESIHEYHRSWG